MLRNLLYFLLGVFLIGTLEVGCASSGPTQNAVHIENQKAVSTDSDPDYEAIKQEHLAWFRCVRTGHDVDEC